MRRYRTSTLSWDDDRLEELLSNGCLSGRQYDEIESRILDRVAQSVPGRATLEGAAQPPAVSRVQVPVARVLVAAAGSHWFLAACAATTLVFLFWAGQEIGDSNKGASEQHGGEVTSNNAAAHQGRGFVAKGDFTRKQQPRTGVFDVGCNNSDSYTCRQGDTLMFSVNAARASGFLNAYAERLGETKAERIWYFPDKYGVAPTIEAGIGTVVLPVGMRVGALHAPGRYRITLWLSRTPMNRGRLNATEQEGLVARDTLLIEVSR